MERHTCKLCFRRFSNGRALGGHMRSHVAAAASTKALLADDGFSSSTSSREEEEAKGMCYGLRENPKKSFRLVDPKFSSAYEAVDGGGGSSVVQDRESETESSPLAASPAGIYRRRSKRPRRSASTSPQEPLSSVSDTTAEEDVALCLMMLSRDVWIKDDDEAEKEEDEEHAIGRIRQAAVAPMPATKGRSRFQCWTCKRVFRSYQALGGHRASHKKLRGCAPPASLEANGDVGDINAEEKGVHECPFCFRVFTSGQALGGHKRSHLSSPATTITSQPLPLPPPSASPATAKLGDRLFDLNLPAPMDEDAELSAVSDPDFIDRPPSPFDLVTPRQ